MLNLKTVFRPYIMKNKIILLAVFLLLSCINCFSQTITQNDVFDCWGDIIGVIKNNEVTFHQYIGSRKRWEKPVRDIPAMRLPNGYREVYSLKRMDYTSDDPQSIMLVINVSDTIQFYENNGSSWKISSFVPSFKLPNGYKSVFGIYVFTSLTGILIGNDIQYYFFNDDKKLWEFYPDNFLNLKIQDGYKGIIFMKDVVGLNINDTIKFYSMDPDKNIAVLKADMKLPNNYKGVFTTTSSNGDIYLGVIFNDRVDFYDFYIDGYGDSLKRMSEISKELLDDWPNDLDLIFNSEEWKNRNPEWKVVPERSFRR